MNYYFFQLNMQNEPKPKITLLKLRKKEIKSLKFKRMNIEIY